MLDQEQPHLFILGGAKFETKLPLLTKYIDIAHDVFVGGALANNFFKIKGLPIGKSLVSDGDFPLQKMWDSGKILLPLDVVVETEAGEHEIRHPEEVLDTDTIMDAGPRTIELLTSRLKKMKSVLWNGPLGAYENGFKEGTLELAHAIA